MYMYDLSLSEVKYDVDQSYITYVKRRWIDP